MRGIEFGAAGLVLLFGIGLLFGYLAAERLTCFQPLVDPASVSVQKPKCRHLTARTTGCYAIISSGDPVSRISTTVTRSTAT